KPQVLVLDEPTSQLDPVGAAEVFTLVRTLNRELRMTVILASHASEEVAEFADRVALLAGGRLGRVAPSAAFFQEVEDLARHQVRAPQVTEFFQHLRGRGLVLDSLPVTLPEAVATYEAVRPQLRFRPLPFAEVPPPHQAVRLTARDLTYAYADGTK